ncbi:MAG: class II aldolase/adducin family protein [Rikenellaceae bacterium]
MKQLDTKLMHPAEQITIIIGRIYTSGMTTTSGGNISIKDDENNIWITPSAVDKGSLKVEDIVCVKADGSYEGKHKPSSELSLHQAIYKLHPKMRSVIHAHAPALVSFGIVHQIPNTNIIPQAKRICGKVGFAKYALPGSDALCENITKEFNEHPDCKAVIMENHGVILYGEDIIDAYQRFETLEFCARTLISAYTLGEPQYLSDEQIEVHNDSLPSYAPHFMGVKYPSDERAIRSEICDLVRRSCNQGLMISSHGTVSVRWKGNDFLITPSGIPRWDLEPDHIVQIKNGLIEAGKMPSRSVAMHQAIYENNPHINSIILTQAPNLMGFCTTDSKFDVRSIPESWIFLQDVPKIDFNVQYDEQGNKNISDTLSKVPCAFLSNDSIIVTGDKLINTFDRLEVAEFTAKSFVMAKSLGTLKPISDKQIEELRVAFNV